MLFPMWATQGCLQPFEFIDLREEDRLKLELDLKKLLSPTAPDPEPAEQASEAVAGSDQ